MKEPQSIYVNPEAEAIEYTSKSMHSRHTTCKVNFDQTLLRKPNATSESLERTY
jgi:hypothetical protein